MIKTCLTKFPLQPSNIQISYIATHSFDNVCSKELDSILEVCISIITVCKNI